jgi:TRAP-type C4-dicarboxylate transport system substrate-binding protein
MIRWNRLRAFFPILLVPLALSVPSVAIEQAGAQAAEPIKIKIHNIGPPRGFLIPLVKWSENVTATTGGKIEFDILWGGVLGTWENQIDNIKAGTFDIGPISPSFLEAKAPLMSSGELPFISSNVVAYGKAALEWLKMPELENEMAAWNQKLLFFTVAPDQEYWGKKSIRSLDDFRGLRAWSGGVFGRALSALGGTPILVPVTELGMGLQRGTFDGIFTGKHLHLAQETYLFSKYRVTPGFGAGIQGISINLDTWNGIPSDLQKVMLDEAQKVPEMYIEIYGDIEKKLQAKSAGKVEFITLSRKLQAEIAALAGKPIWEEYIKEKEAKGLPARRVVERLLELVAKYE